MSRIVEGRGYRRSRDHRAAQIRQQIDGQDAVPAVRIVILENFAPLAVEEQNRAGVLRDRRVQPVMQRPQAHADGQIAAQDGGTVDRVDRLIPQRQFLGDQKGLPSAVRIEARGREGAVAGVAQGGKPSACPLLLGRVGQGTHGGPGILVAVGQEETNFVVLGIGLLIAGEEAKQRR